MNEKGWLPDMVILLFGISNIGKTKTGEKLAEKLGYSFLDLDEEIKKRLNTTLEEFIREYPFPHGRYKVKGKILRDLVNNPKENTVIAVSPIYYARNFNSLLDLEQVVAIELQDSEEHIFQRLIFSDQDDNPYHDDEYKEEHKDSFLKAIHGDIVYARKCFKKITNKYFIDNKPINQVVEDLIVMIENLT